jgi:YgiT-type zinc finger domain-containing protein
MNNHRLEYDYGACDICDTPLQAMHIHQDIWVNAQLVVVDGVPAGVCPRCGTKVVRADVGKWLAAVIENPEVLVKAPTISVPLIQYSS